MKSTGSTSSRTKLFAAGVAVVAIALVALLLPAAAGAVPGGGTGGLQSAGVLRLQLGATDRFRFEPTSGSAVNQSIGVSNGCKLALGTSPAASNLVSLLPNSGNTYAGFVDNGIGVKSSGEGNGSPCGRIDAGQQLTLNLNQGSGQTLAGKMIDFAEIDLEGKFSANMQVQGWLVRPGKDPVLMKTETYSTTAGGSDSGPDSGDGDNYRVRFPKTGTTIVNRLVFSLVGNTGAMSLEGGADGTAPCDTTDSADCNPGLGQTLNTTDSLFHLVNVDGILDCGDQVTEDGGGTVPTNTLERLDNATGTCVPIPYSLDASLTCPQVNFTQCVLLQKNLGGQNAQFFWTVSWAPEPGAYMESPTLFDFDGDGVYSPIQQCLGDGLAGGAPDGFPDLPPSVEDPGTTDPWCVVNTQTEYQLDPVNGQTFDQVTEKYFGSGDPGGARHG